MVKENRKNIMVRDISPDTLILENPRALARQTVAQLQAEWEAILQPPSPPSTPEPQPSYKGYRKLNFLDACRYGDGDVAKLKKIIFLKKLVFQTVDIHENNGQALRSAAENGHTEVIQFLLENDANIHASEDTALRWAARNGHMAATRLLLDHGADIHAQHDYALRYAAHNGRSEIVQELLSHGADIHADNNGALRWAAEHGHTDTVRLLLNHGADIHADNDGALRWAASEKHMKTVDLLVKQGALLETLQPLQRHEYIAYQKIQAKEIISFKTTARETLTAIFNAATWTGHAPEMSRLWSEVPEELKTDIDFQHALSDTNIQTLKQRKPKIRLIR
jgi:ankyrin repeat protein